MLFLMLLLIGLLAWPRTYVYTFSVQTEVAEFTIKRDINVEHFNLGVALPTETSKGFKEIEDANLEIQTGTTVRAVRKGKGPLILQLTSKKPDQPAGKIETGLGQSQSVPFGTELKIDIPPSTGNNRPSSETFIMPFQGILAIGEDVAPKVKEILLAGKVQIIEQLPFFGQRYILETTELNRGDRVYLHNTGTRSSDNPSEPIAEGFIYVGGKDAMYVTAHVKADEVKVIRFGAKAYTIEPSLLSRIIASPSTTLVVLIPTLLASLVIIWQWLTGERGSGD